MKYHSSYISSPRDIRLAENETVKRRDNVSLLSSPSFSFFLSVGFHVKFQRFRCFNIFFFFWFSFFPVAMSIGTKKNKGTFEAAFRSILSFVFTIFLQNFLFFEIMHGINRVQDRVHRFKIIISLTRWLMTMAINFYDEREIRLRRI